METGRYDILPPEVGESKRDYALRLQQLGHEEMFIRKALAYHLNVELPGLAAFFNDFEMARLRHITMLKQLAPNRSHYSMVKKVAKNLGLSQELADRWVTRHAEVSEVSEVTYIDMDKHRRE